MQTRKVVDDMSDNDIFLKVKEKVTNILLTSNGSTTRLLEAISGKTMEINVQSQETVSKSDLLDDFNEMVEHSNMYLQRKVSLHSKGEIFSDNFVIGIYENFSKEVKKGLLRGEVPIGKLINDEETRKEFVWAGQIDKSTLETYFSECKFILPHYPGRKYLLYVNGCCWFYILEVFHIENIIKAMWE